MAYILTGILIVLYLYGLFRWDKIVVWRLNPRTSRIIKYIHFIFIVISISIAFTFLKYDIGLRGLWTTRIITIIALITGIVFIFISNKSIINRLEKIYFKAFSFLPLIALGTLLVPFLGVVIVVSLLGHLFVPAQKIHFQDNNIRVQSSFGGVLGLPKLDIYQKTYIFERHVYHSENDISSDSLKVKYDKNLTEIIFYQKDTANDTIKVMNIKE